MWTDNADGTRTYLDVISWRSISSTSGNDVPVSWNSIRDHQRDDWCSARAAVVVRITAALRFRDQLALVLQLANYLFEDFSNESDVRECSEELDGAVAALWDAAIGDLDDP